VSGSIPEAKIVRTRCFETALSSTLGANSNFLLNQLSKMHPVFRKLTAFNLRIKQNASCVLLRVDAANKTIMKS
jgi:hypothetical protein